MSNDLKEEYSSYIWQASDDEMVNQRMYLETHQGDDSVPTLERINEVFGSWAQALEYCGLSNTVPKLKPEGYEYKHDVTRIRASLLAFTRTHGRYTNLNTYLEWHKKYPKSVCYRTILRYHGSWKAALESIGKKQHKPYKIRRNYSYTIDELLDILVVPLEMGYYGFKDYEKWRDMQEDRDAYPSHQTYIYRFGSWNNAKAEAIKRSVTLSN